MSNNLIISVIELVPLFSGIMKACTSCCQGDIDLKEPSLVRTVTWQISTI